MTRIYTTLFLLSILFSSAVSAQVFPYIEGFDSYTVNQPLNANGGIVATSHIYVTPHGIVGNCAEFQMSSTALHDTMISPLIGPLTAHSSTTFYFRAVTYSGVNPSLYSMTGTDQVQIIVGTTNFGLSSLQYTINNSNQNTTTNYIRATVPIPGFLAGLSGKFKIVANNASGHNWLFELDSLVVRDTLLVPPVLSSVVVNDSCKGDSTGSIHVNASGASSPYTYHWNTGATTSTITHLPAGIYSVTVTDSLNATATLSDTIKEPQFQLQLDSLVKTNINCHGGATGTAEIYPKGGTPSYNYLWSTSPTQSTQKAINIPAGTYSVTVTDSRGCTVTATSQFIDPPALTVIVTSTASSGSNGTATAIVNGGTSPFTFLWTPTGQTSALATGLAPGGYVVDVTDAHGCLIADTITVANVNGIQSVDDKALDLYPNPASDKIYVSMEGGSQFTVSISDMSGRMVLTDNAPSQYINTSSLTEGVYVVRVNSGSKAYVRKVVIER